MDYKVRELKTKDIYKMSKILKKLKLKVETTSNVMDEEGKEVTRVKSQVQLAAELILNLFENLGDAEKEANLFISDLVGLTVEEFEELPIIESVKIIKQVREMEGIKDFLKQAGI